VSDENKAAAASDPEEVLSYWFPEDLINADPETRRRQGDRWMRGGPEVDRDRRAALSRSPLGGASPQ